MRVVRISAMGRSAGKTINRVSHRVQRALPDVQSSPGKFCASHGYSEKEPIAPDETQDKGKMFGSSLTLTKEALVTRYGNKLQVMQVYMLECSKEYVRNTTNDLGLNFWLREISSGTF